MKQYLHRAFKPFLVKCPAMAQVARVLTIVYLAQAGVGVAIGVAYALWLIYLT